MQQQVKKVFKNITLFTKVSELLKTDEHSRKDHKF